MGVNSYFEFAEDDYKYFIEDYNNGRVANYMASNAQNICERYLKHIIAEYKKTCTAQEAVEKTEILRTHSLNKLCKYLSKNLGVELSIETKNEMSIINGFYFSARYPGDDSFFVDKEDIIHCATAVEKCREETIKAIQSFEKEKEQPHSNILNQILNGDIPLPNSSGKPMIHEDI